MRHFAGPGIRLWNLSREAKLVYTFFCVFSLGAMASSVLLYEDMVGPALRGGAIERVRRYYGAQAALPPAEAAAPRGGPAIDVPTEAAEEARITVAMPARKLLEVTHFHLFTVPVFLLIISHLFMLGGAGPRAKVAWIVAGWSAAALHLLAPWLTRAAGGLAFTYPLSGAALLVSCIVLAGYPVWGMWHRPRPAAGAS